MKLFLFLASAALTALALSSSVRHAWPHDWYPADCCSGSHCRPVACTTIVTHADGSVDWTGLYFTKDQVYASQDAGCHVCVGYPMTGQRWPYCAFIATTM